LTREITLDSTVEQLSTTRVKINVEVPFDELEPDFDRAYAKLAKQVRIPGFRPGKAPARVLESHLGRGAVVDEVVNEAVPTKYREAVDASDVHTLGQPDIEVTNIADGDAVSFTAEVDVRPEIVLPSFDEFSVTVEDVEVTDEQVSGELDDLRARFGTLTGVERPAQQDDFVSIDLSATVDGQELPEAATSGLSYQVGSGDLVDGLDEALAGMRAGEQRTFTTTLVAGEHAGKEAEVTVTLGSVKERELPEADDEFAELASEFDTMDELTESLREQLAERNRTQQALQARDHVLAALLDAVEIELPESIVAQEVELREHEALGNFDHDEARFVEFLTQQGQTREQFAAEARADAERAVKTQLILDQIAEREGVDVAEADLTQRIIYDAQRYGVSPEEYLQRAQQSGQLGSMFADIRRAKALAGVVRAATVTDESGTQVDLSEMFGDEDAEQDDEAAEGGVVEGEAREIAEPDESDTAEAGAESG
jgi:trigger factor